MRKQRANKKQTRLLRSGRSHGRQRDTGSEHSKRYDYAVPHLRKCEKCLGLFTWNFDLTVVKLNLHYTCPKCRSKRKR